MQEKPSIVWVSPFPPLASGISQYSQDLLEAVGSLWRPTVIAESGSGRLDIAGVTAMSAGQVRGEDMLILHLGNSGFHPTAFQLAARHQAVVVLHDVVLHHARLADFVQRGRGRDYLAVMMQQYGVAGAELGRDVLRGANHDVTAYPLSEDVIESARMVVVHSEHARQQVLQHVASAEVRVVPMGVPLPALLDKQQAREHLGLPEDAYIITSITHVNPMKRLPIVLRALRRVVEREPRALLVIAGTIAVGMNIERQVSLLGLERHVRIVGYLSDADSRILARAGDVSVNLRYPSTGETSASLLRLMGAARPVVVTAHGAALEIPAGAVLHLPVDRLEEETLAEYLMWLAEDVGARIELGNAARAFVEGGHSIGAAVDGYRRVLHEAYAIELPALDNGLLHEHSPALLARPTGDGVAQVEEPVLGYVADAIASLGLASHDGTIQRTAAAFVALGLDDIGGEARMKADEERTIAPELLEILVCPVCKSAVRLENGELVCEGCGRHYRIEDGIPIMLAEDESDD